MSDYHVNVFFSDEDGGYIADIPDLQHDRAAQSFGLRDRPLTRAG